MLHLKIYIYINNIFISKEAKFNVMTEHTIPVYYQNVWVNPKNNYVPSSLSQTTALATEIFKASPWLGFAQTKGMQNASFFEEILVWNTKQNKLNSLITFLLGLYMSLQRKVLQRIFLILFLTVKHKDHTSLVHYTSVLCC